MSESWEVIGDYYVTLSPVAKQSLVDDEAYSYPEGVSSQTHYVAAANYGVESSSFMICDLHVRKYIFIIG